MNWRLCSHCSVGSWCSSSFPSPTSFGGRQRCYSCNGSSQVALSSACFVFWFAVAWDGQVCCAVIPVPWQSVAPRCPQLVPAWAQTPRLCAGGWGQGGELRTCAQRELLLYCTSLWSGSGANLKRGFQYQPPGLPQINSTKQKKFLLICQQQRCCIQGQPCWQCWGGSSASARGHHIPWQTSPSPALFMDTWVSPQTPLEPFIAGSGGKWWSFTEVRCPAMNVGRNEPGGLDVDVGVKDRMWMWVLRTAVPAGFGTPGTPGWQRRPWWALAEVPQWFQWVFLKGCSWHTQSGRELLCVQSCSQGPSLLWSSYKCIGFVPKAARKAI